MFLYGCASPPRKGSGSVTGTSPSSSGLLEELLKEHSYRNPYFLAASQGATMGLFLNAPERILWLKNKSVEMQDFSDRGPAQKFLQNTPQNWTHVAWSKKTAKFFLSGTEQVLTSPLDLNVKAKVDLFSFDLESGKVVQFTRSVAYNGEASVSPDGEWVAFSSGREGDFEIYLVRADGNDLTRVTNRPGYDGDPSFSPDGKYLMWRAFRAERQDLSDIYVARLLKDGRRFKLTDQKNLTHREFALFLTPSWHPESTHIVFASNRAELKQLDLYLADLEFRCVQRITDSRENEIFPTISTDGRFLMWTGKQKGASGLFLSPFSFLKAPCDGSRRGVETDGVEFKGVDGR